MSRVAERDGTPLFARGIFGGASAFDTRHFLLIPALLQSPFWQASIMATSLAVPLAYITVLVTSLAIFSRVYRRRKAGEWEDGRESRNIADRDALSSLPLHYRLCFRSTSDLIVWCRAGISRLRTSLRSPPQPR